VSDADGLVAMQETQLCALLDSLAGGAQVQFSGMVVDVRTLAAILEWAPIDDDGRPVLVDAQFEGTRFDGHADFAGAVFRGEANFEGAVFCGDVSFAEVLFAGAARFADSRFAGDASFEEAEFLGDARFTASEFARDARFDDVRFRGEARFAEAKFAGEVHFTAGRVDGELVLEDAAFEDDAHFDRVVLTKVNARHAAFAKDVWFDDATVTGRAHFAGARFREGAWFAGVVCGELASFYRAAFENARDIGPLLVLGELSFEEADFSLPVRIEAAARRATWQAARFRTGGDLSLRWAEVNLERADFGGPSVVSALPPGPGERALGLEEPLSDAGWVCHGKDKPAGGYSPRLISLRSAKLADLALSEVDLRACSFNRAQGLDSLRLERVRFAESPSARSYRRPWRWTRRQTLAEEHRWRHEQGAWGWNGPETQAPQWVGHVDPPSAEELAGLYRALRAGREGIKDEPGAADFYYGEMEMRRQKEPGTGFGTRPTPSVERWLINLYWLVSGYALRSSRVLVALALVIALFAAAFGLFGFKAEGLQTRVERVTAEGTLVYDDVPASTDSLVSDALDALIFSAGTSTAVLAAPSRPLTRAGQSLRVLLRVVGPILVGLALLSFRGRVKR
jgi:uncharacterized protein YjbI with pentapeptide repeats